MGNDFYQSPDECRPGRGAGGAAAGHRHGSAHRGGDHRQELPHRRPRADRQRPRRPVERGDRVRHDPRRRGRHPQGRDPARRLDAVARMVRQLVRSRAIRRGRLNCGDSAALLEYDGRDEPTPRTSRVECPRGPGPLDGRPSVGLPFPERQDHVLPGNAGEEPRSAQQKDLFDVAGEAAERVGSGHGVRGFGPAMPCWRTRRARVSCQSGLLILKDRGRCRRNLGPGPAFPSPRLGGRRFAGRWRHQSRFFDLPVGDGKDLPGGVLMTDGRVRFLSHHGLLVGRRFPRQDRTRPGGRIALLLTTSGECRTALIVRAGAASCNLR